MMSEVTGQQKRPALRQTLKALFYMAERVGFEPTVRCRITGFQDQLLKPLGHLSSAMLYYYINWKIYCQIPYDIH